MQWSFTGPAGLLFAGLTESRPQMAPLHNSGRSGTRQRNPKSSILFRVPGVSTRTSVRVSPVRVSGTDSGLSDSGFGYRVFCPALEMEVAKQGLCSSYART